MTGNTSKQVYFYSNHYFFKLLIVFLKPELKHYHVNYRTELQKSEAAEFYSHFKEMSYLLQKNRIE